MWNCFRDHGNLQSSQLILTVFVVKKLVSGIRHSSEFLLPNLNKPLLLQRNSLSRALGLCLYFKVGFNLHWEVPMQMTAFMIIYHTFPCKRMIGNCSLFSCDLNAHHRDWLNEVSLTDRHGDSALDFSGVFACQ